MTKQSNIEKANSVSKEFTIGIIKGAIGTIPVFGGYLNEALFDIRGRIKQTRFEKFVKSLEEQLALLSENNINQAFLQTEEFSDILENIFNKVVLTQSKEKTEIYRNMLVHSIDMSKIEILDITTFFLEIVNNLSEQELILLKSLRHKYTSSLLTNELEDFVNETNPEAKYLHEVKSYQVNYAYEKIFGLNKIDFRLCFESLISKSLVYDDGLGGIGGGELRSKIGLTHLGHRLIEFILKIDPNIPIKEV